MRVGILGYGNLGKALVKELKNTSHTLVAVFSRRKIYEESFRILPREDIYKYVGDIDALLVATSGYSATSNDTKEFLPCFNTIDSYDNHQSIPARLEELTAVARRNNRIAITAAGWDPGLLSVARALAKISVGAENQNTFWGPGKSLGHTSLLMSIDGVKYAAQYTVPKDESVTLSKNTDASLISSDTHYRQCFIVPDPSADLKKIESQIRGIDGYFKGYDISVSFITESEFIWKHNKDFHRGEVIATKINSENKTSFDLKLDVPSNSAFTASIMLSYINAIDYLQKRALFGAYTPLDIPMSLLISRENYGNLI